MICLCARRHCVQLEHARESLCKFLLLGSIGSLRGNHRVHLRKDILRGGHTCVEGLALEEFLLLNIHRLRKTFLDRGRRVPVRAHAPRDCLVSHCPALKRDWLELVFFGTSLIDGSFPPEATPRPSPSVP